VTAVSVRLSPSGLVVQLRDARSVATVLAQVRLLEIVVSDGVPSRTATIR
jgi:hypothetical protein